MKGVGSQPGRSWKVASLWGCGCEKQQQQQGSPGLVTYPHGVPNACTDAMLTLHSLLLWPLLEDERKLVRVVGGVQNGEYEDLQAPCLGLYNQLGDQTKPRKLPEPLRSALKVKRMDPNAPYLGSFYNTWKMMPSSWY